MPGQIVGQCLARIWYTLTESQIDSIIAQICDFDGQLLQTNFPAIGSLQKQDSEFIVGRAGLSCVAPYRFRKDVGPWQSSVAFIDAHIKAELDLLENDPDEWARERLQVAKLRNLDLDHGPNVLAYFRTWYRLFSRGINRLDLTEYDPPNCPFVLYHQDVTVLNIMVAYDDPSRVVAIIDWEGSRVLPLWCCLGPDPLLQDYCLRDEQHLSRLRDCRRRAHETMQPAVKLVRKDRLSLPHLLNLASSRFSVNLPTETLNEQFRTWLFGRPEKDVRLFKDLIMFISTGQSKSTSCTFATKLTDNVLGVANG
jgi:hypothetical protein